MALALAGCAGGAAPASPAASRAAPADRVEVVEPAGRPEAWGFAPATIAVARGATVTWHNGGQAFHTVTADAPGRPFDVALQPGAGGTVAFASAGTFAYHCGVHPQMTGVVVVCDGACP